MTSVSQREGAGLDARLRDRGFIISGETIPLALNRLRLSARQVAGIRRATETVLRVLVRFGHAYPEEPGLQAALDLPPLEDEFVRLDPSRWMSVQIGRFDGLLTATGIRIVELNADTPGAMGYADVAHDVLESVRPTGFPRVALLPRIVEALLSAYRASRPRSPRPRIAVVDATITTWHDIELAVNALAGAGLDVTRVRPDELQYDGSRLTAGGATVDLVWRRVLFEEVDEGALTAAVRDGRVVVVNPFTARVANNKKLLALIADPAFGHLISSRERRVLDEAVARTEILLPGVAERCAQRRESLVIKPATGHAGEGVHIGLETDQGRWQRLIADVALAGTHVVQEYVPSPVVAMPVLDRGVCRPRRMRVSVSPFLIGGRYAGTMARVADRQVVNLMDHGAFLSCVEAPSD